MSREIHRDGVCRDAAPGVPVRPEELLAWVAGYAAELNRAAGGPLRRVAVTSGGVTVEVEWSATAAPPAPVTAGVNGNGGVVPAVNGGGAVPADGAAAGPPAGFAAAEEDDAIVITAPMVGTFYRSPEPGAPPYVEVGDEVEAGQQVGIIEAMKLMNPIVAEQAGRVHEILAADGAPVEYAEPLIVLRPGDGH